ncbi:MAG: DUF1761 domain-containing protein [Candidatus Staskawiczbacteria bacterium]|nr:DUF1761 domain-containing protein [Candidatus Staskawiczbacteria bacterium]
MITAVPVNYVALIVATIASMAIGFMWYGPLLGKLWVKEMGWSEADMKTAQAKWMTRQYVLMMLGSLVMAFVLLHNLTFGSAYLQMTGVSAGLQAGFWNWLGFIVPITLSAVLWEGKSWKLFCINVGYYLVTLLVMGAILAGWM